MRAEMTEFVGFDRDAMQFFHELSLEMNRDWYEANKDRYKTRWVEPMTALLSTVAARLAKQGVHVEHDPARLRPQVADEGRARREVGVELGERGPVLIRDEDLVRNARAGQDRHGMRDHPGVDRIGDERDAHASTHRPHALAYGHDRHHQPRFR